MKSKQNVDDGNFIIFIIIVILIIFIITNNLEVSLLWQQQ